MTAGIWGTVYHKGVSVSDCLIIGRGVPHIHHAYEIPVYLVAEHELGAAVRFKDGVVRKLLAYPSGWPGPGEATPHRYIVALHAHLAWWGGIPLFDGE